MAFQAATRGIHLLGEGVNEGQTACRKEEILWENMQSKRDYCLWSIKQFGKTKLWAIKELVEKKGMLLQPNLYIII